jgi:hypothetical protein
MILTSIFTGGFSPFGVIHDSTKPRKPLRELTDDEWRDWLRPLVWTATNRGQVVVLYDALPAAVLSSLSELFRLVPVAWWWSYQSYTRRWLAYRSCLGPCRSWSVTFVDAGDVLLLADPPDRLWCVAEPTTYGTCEWSRDHASRLPGGPEFLAAHADEPVLNCGAWGGPASEVWKIMDRMCDALEKAPGDDRTCADMLAFRRAVGDLRPELLPRFGDRVIHDRGACEAWLAKNG